MSIGYHVVLLQSMKNLLYYILLMVGTMVAACSQGTHQRQLVQVDSLMGKFLRDSAFEVFRQINPDQLSGRQEQMYYDILKVELSCVSIHGDSLIFDTPVDSVISECIDYFERNHDLRKLLLCYLYRGKLYTQNYHNYDKATVWLKKAEELLDRVNDLRLSYQTYETLSALNYYTKNEDLYLEYSYKMLSRAEQSGINTMMIYACNHLVVVYTARNELDSVRKYSNRSMSILGQMLPKSRATALCNLGSVYLNNHQLDSADIYFQRAYDEYPLSFINQRRAIIYYERGEHKKADSLWHIAQQSSDMLDKVETFSYMLDEKYSHQDYEGASLAAMRLLELKDSLSGQENTVEVLKIQKKYDKEVARRKLHQTVIRFLLGGLAMIAVLTVLIIVHIRKSHRNKELILRNEALIGDYQRQIKQLEQSGEEVIGRINELRQRIVSLQTERAKKISEGEELYHRILNGEPIESWSKDEIQNFIDYYKLVNLSFMLEMERDYTNLSPGNRLFLILEHEGKTNDELSHILGVTSTTLRSSRLRLRKKHNPIS